MSLSAPCSVHMSRGVALNCVCAPRMMSSHAPRFVDAEQPRYDGHKERLYVRL